MAWYRSRGAVQLITGFLLVTIGLWNYEVRGGAWNVGTVFFGVAVLLFGMSLLVLNARKSKSGR